MSTIGTDLRGWPDDEQCDPEAKESHQRSKGHQQVGVIPARSCDACAQFRVAQSSDRR